MIPVINLNGKTKEAHLRDYQAVIDALRDTMKAMQEIRPHGRDYQTLRNDLAFGAYNSALDDFNARFGVVDQLCNDFQEDLYAIYKQGT